MKEVSSLNNTHLEDISWLYRDIKFLFEWWQLNISRASALNEWNIFQHANTMWAQHKSTILIIDFELILSLIINIWYLTWLAFWRLNTLLTSSGALVTTKRKHKRHSNNIYLLTESEVFTGKTQTETLQYWPSDTFLLRPNVRGQYFIFIILLFALVLQAHNHPMGITGE